MRSKASSQTIAISLIAIFAQSFCQKATPTTEDKKKLANMKNISSLSLFNTMSKVESFFSSNSVCNEKVQTREMSDR